MSDIFDEQNQIKANYIKWGKVADFISGTLIDVREVASNLPDKQGEMQKNYEILVESGSYHNIDENKKVAAVATSLVVGDVYIVGGKVGIDAQMRRVEIGQKIGMKFISENPPKTKGYNPFKLIKVYTTGEKNQEWLEKQGLSVKDIVG